ncbi:MAG: hypothetical protein LBP51_06670 [Deferribacteraceae bacterium]|jgi:hypothetical protein|nr:hypothetical protein [Deferribacteraceae bacterium]
MSTSGITTVVSTSSIPEKMQDSTERMAEHRQQMTGAVVQQSARERVKTVKRGENAESSKKVKEKKSDANKEGKKEGSGGNLDLRA